MKKIFKSLALVAVAAASLISCQKPNPVEPGQQEYTYTFTLGSENTKSVLTFDKGSYVTHWEANDLLGVYIAGGTNSFNNAKTTVNIESDPVTFTLAVNKNLTAGQTLYAYYPYTVVNNSTPNSAPMKIPTNQDGYMDAMPMACTGVTFSENLAANVAIPMGDVNMSNLGGIFQFRIFSATPEYRSETLKGVKFIANQAIAGEFTYDLTTGGPISGYTENEVMIENTATIGSTKDDAGILNLIVAPGTYTGSIVVYTDRAEYTFSLSSPKSVERSHIKPLNADLANASRISKLYEDKYEVKYGKSTEGWTIKDTEWGTDYWGLATATWNIVSPEIDMSKVKSISVYGRTYGSTSGNSNKLDIKIGSSVKKTFTMTNTYAEYVYTPTEGELSGAAALTFQCEAGSNTSNSKVGLRIQRITIRYVDDSWAPKIVDGEISQVPARSSNGRFTIQTKNIDSALEILNYSGIDFDEIDIENGNELVYTVSDNDSKDVKNGTITVALASDNSVTGIISISQAAARFTAARASVDLKAKAESQTTVTITSDFDWTISGVDAGYTVSPSSFTYNPDASEPGKKTITIKATGANSGDSTVDLGSFSIVNAKSAFGSIEISVNQLSSKLPKPTITNVTGIAADKQAVIQWSKINNASTYTYYLINDNAEEVEGSRKTAEDSDELSATVDIPNYGENYYFCIFAVGSGDWTDSQEATSDAINLTEPSGSFTGTIASWSSTSSNTISSNAWASKGTGDMCGTNASITLKNSGATVQSITSQSFGSGANAWYLVYGYVAGNSYWDISMTTTQNLASGTKIKVVAYLAVNSKGITSWKAKFNAGGSSDDVQMGDNITGVVTNGAPSKLTDMTKVERVYTLTSDVASGTTIHVKLVADSGTAKNGRLSDVTVTAE